MDQILTSIEQLTKALNLLNGEFDPIEIRNLTLCADQKHKAYVEKGLIENNKTEIAHGIMGALSHYESEREKQIREKKLAYKN